MLRALEEEYKECIGVLSSRLYYNAFQVCIIHGDQARASVFTERAYNIRVVVKGKDSPKTQRMKTLTLKPADHNAFRLCSMR